MLIVTQSQSVSVSKQLSKHNSPISRAKSGNQAMYYKSEGSCSAECFAMQGALFTIQHFCRVTCTVLYLTPPNFFTIKLQREPSVWAREPMGTFCSMSCQEQQSQECDFVCGLETLCIQYCAHTDPADPLFPVCSFL